MELFDGFPLGLTLIHLLEDPKDKFKGHGQFGLHSVGYRLARFNILIKRYLIQINFFFSVIRYSVIKWKRGGESGIKGMYYHEQLNGNVSEIYHSGFVPKLVLMKNNL